jgi:hypothetical protein
MSLLHVYGECLLRTFRVLGRNLWTVVLPIAYLAVVAPMAALLAPLRFIGGFLFALALAALAASLLYVVSELVRGMPVRLREMPQSARPFFWPIMNVAFVFWVADFFLRPALAQVPSGEAILVALNATLFVLFNAVPEVIYQKGEYGGLAAMMASVKFIEEHWIEWLIPNVALGAGFWFGLSALQSTAFGFVLEPVAFGALLLWALVFRGFLFEALDRSGARQRALRYRLGGR